jgi:hypothetical protein
MVEYGLIRKPTLFAPTALTTASVTSNTMRRRFSTEPPYSSVRLLDAVWRNWSRRNPLAAWISTPSNPAFRTAFFGGGGVQFHVFFDLLDGQCSGRLVAFHRDGARAHDGIVARLPKDVAFCDTAEDPELDKNGRPVCVYCVRDLREILTQWSDTIEAKKEQTGFHPAIWSSFQMPGTCAFPPACGARIVPSVTARVPGTLVRCL